MLETLLTFFIENRGPWAGETVPQLKAIAAAALAKDSNVIPSTHTAAPDLPTVTVSEDLMPSSDLSGMRMVHI